MTQGHAIPPSRTLWSKKREAEGNAPRDSRALAATRRMHKAKAHGPRALEAQIRSWPCRRGHHRPTDRSAGIRGTPTPLRDDAAAGGEAMAGAILAAGHGPFWEMDNFPLGMNCMPLPNTACTCGASRPQAARQASSAGSHALTKRVLRRRRGRVPNTARMRLSSPLVCTRVLSGPHDHLSRGGRATGAEAGLEPTAAGVAQGHTTRRCLAGLYVGHGQRTPGATSRAKARTDPKAAPTLAASVCTPNSRIAALLCKPCFSSILSFDPALPERNAAQHEPPDPGLGGSPDELLGLGT